MNRIVIAVDKGHFKAYRMTKAPMESARLEMIENYDSVDAHGKMSEKVSDKAGNFGLGGGRNGAATGFGEPHSIEQEAEKRVIKLLAKDINALIDKENCDKWCFAASRELNSQILENLNPIVRAKLEKNIAADLTKADKAELISRFA